MLKAASVGVLGSTLLSANAAAQESMDTLEIMVPRAETVEYTFTSDATVERVTGNSFIAAEESDTITESDGTWTVSGSTNDGYGDTFKLAGPVRSFEPSEGNYLLYLNGERISRDDLVEPKETREHSYSFEATGDSWADYYLEVEDDGKMIASTLDGATIDPDFHWISKDGTKAAGRIHPGDRHAYEFDNLVLDVTIDGQAEAYVDGRESSVDRYPQPGATGDSWKSGFPWQQEDDDIDRTHSYSFEATGDSWADYYLEVEDGGKMVASTLDGATIDPEFHWVSDDGTKAAGRIHPGDRHAYEFDTLVQDVTIEGGEAEALVNGEPSSLHIYPQEGATGDDWKGGFPWQDEETQQEEETTDRDGVAMGGGPGYENIVTRDDADAVAQNASELSSALSSASSGDIVFVPGDAVIDTGSQEFNVPSGVTLASNRGQNGSDGALLRTDEEPDAVVDLSDSGARLTGMRIRGPFPDSDVTYQSGISFSNEVAAGVNVTGADCEIDNNEIWGFGYAGIFVAHNGDGGQQIHHNYVYQNNTQGLGYGVSVGYGSNLNPTIEYNYFDENRHSVAADGRNYGYVCRYNHFGPTSVMHPIDIHDPGAQDSTIEGNVVETMTRTWDDNCCPAIDGFDDTEGVIRIQDNWFWNDSCTYDVPVGDSDVEVSGNELGEGAASFGDTIPNHPGADDRPWA